MCGIAGIVINSPLEPSIMPKMINSLHHRGPDYSASVQFLRNNYFINLGHTRLSIIDLSDGNQPMFNQDKSICVVFNGEIYNFLEIRSALEKKGYVFRTKSDTETIIYLYEEYGDELGTYLDGMFAFALWDQKAGKLLLGRDISGKKPLYYYENGETFIFASEIKAIVNSGLYHSQVNVERLPNYLMLGYVSYNETLYKNILKLPAASIGIKYSGRGLNIKQYWDWITEKSLAKYKNFDFNREETVIEHLRYLVIESVKKRLISDVPLGCFLSGGVDSAIIVGTIAKILKKPISTFTIGFADNPEFDESEAALGYANRFGSIHSNYTIELDPLLTFKQLLKFHDEPFGDTSSLPTYSICKEARKHVTVCLSGDGGDELFAGYARFKNILKVASFPNYFKRIAAFVPQILPTNEDYFSTASKISRYARYMSLEPTECFFDWNSFFFQHELEILLNDSFHVQKNREELISHWHDIQSGFKGVGTLNTYLYLNYKTYLYDDLNIKADKMSMANGLETRSPFLDRDLTEFCALMPGKYKIKGDISKYILKKAFSDLLTEEDLKRKKQGFAVPVDEYFLGPLERLFKEHMYDQSANIYKYLNFKNTKTYMDQHFTGVRKHGQQFWLLLNLKIWLDSF